MVDLERQDFETLGTACSNNIYALSTRIRQTQRLVSKVERDPKLSRNSEKLSSEMVAIGDKCSETSAMVEELNNWPSNLLSASQKSQQVDINNGFNTVLKSIHSLQQTAAKAIQKVASIAKPTPGGNGITQGSSSNPIGEATPLLQQLVSTDLTLHNDLLEDREQEIEGIQRGMLEINSIFKDLGVLVAEQGANLDTIEENISDMARQTNDASNQLTKAENYQRSRGKWSCIALLFLLFLTVLVAISIFS